jgi:tRNA dimethylallyltransferase
MTALRWIGLTGPTATGKSAAALLIARSLRVEIVSVDSALVYRGMDIGTAKPTEQERAMVPHHLIDLIEPYQAYSVAQFVADATRLIDEIHARGAMPLLVGGTMLYFNALLGGIDALPEGDPDLRARLDAQAAALGWPAMHAQLERVDPAAAARLPPNDAQRIQRALEVWHLTGRALSSFHSGKLERTTQAPPGVQLVSLEPQDRGWLHARAAQRFQAMLDAGLEDEVRALRRHPDLSLTLPSMRCVGYRQVWEMLDGEFPREELPARGTAATRQLAKRQLTWLRSMPWRQVIASDAPDSAGTAVRAVQALVAAHA